MNYLFYSDLHIRPERLADCEKVLEQIHVIANKLRDKYGDLIIVNGGDTFNTRGIIRTVCFDRLFNHYSKWLEDEFRQIILVGNHDQEDREGEIHPMRVFASWDGWKVVDTPQVISGMAFFPYMEIKERGDIYKHVKEGFKGDAVVHWGIRGAKRNDHNVDRDGVPVEWLDGFRNVFSGHYHFRNKINNVQYIGSPLQQNFGEAGQNKGVIFYDSKANRQSFIEIKGTPKHYTVEIESDLKEKKWTCKEGLLDDIGPTDFVRAQVHGDAESCNTLTRDRLADSLGVENIKIERFVREKHFSRLNIKESEVLSPESLATKYVDYVDTPLDKTRLLGIGKEILA